MTDGTELTTVDIVREEGSVLFTVTDTFDIEEEVVLVPCESWTDEADSDGVADAERATDGEVAAWINRCTHEPQRFDTGRGVAIRDGEMVCPRHGSTFDTCTGHCDNGDAAGSTLPEVGVSVVDGTVYLTDEDYEFAHEGGIDDSDGPSSTSHVGF